MPVQSRQIISHHEFLMYSPPILKSWRPALFTEIVKSFRNDHLPSWISCGTLPGGPNLKPFIVMIGEPLVMPSVRAAGWFSHGTRDDSRFRIPTYPLLKSLTALLPSTCVSASWIWSLSR